MHTDVSITKSERDGEVFGGLVRIGSNPSGSRPNFFGRQHLTFDKGGKFSTGRGDGCAFEKVVEIERVDATGGASKARKPEMNAQRLCTDAKPTERS